MTAEIAILNRGAVALAADSAVTVGDDSGSKAYNTVNKLFTLSKFHPVGIMMNGNADYMTIPWETVIKLYREELGTRSFSTIAAYARHFVRYLNREFTISHNDEKDRIHQIWLAYFESLNTELRQILLDKANQNPITQTDVNKEFLALVSAYVSGLREKRTIGQYRSVRSAVTMRRYGQDLSAITKVAFRGRQITRAIARSLRELAFLILVKDEFRLSTTGIVIAGFGAEEIFPNMCALQCAGKIFGRLKVKIEPNMAITSKHNESVYIRHFAQGEMVDRFMEGIDPIYSMYIRDGATHLLERLATDLVMKYSTGGNALKTRRASSARRTARKMINEFERSAERFRYGVFVKPILDIVSILPKEELAELAGALVSITSLKRKISFEVETVGGPVDVAVISKGDGFIWIRRKHYFKPELNPSFLQNYLSSSRA